MAKDRMARGSSIFIKIETSLVENSKIIKIKAIESAF
jgi:hypothetical protein